MLNLKELIESDITVESFNINSSNLKDEMKTLGKGLGTATLAASKVLRRATIGLLRGIGKVDEFIGFATGFNDFKSALVVSQETGVPLNRLTLEMMKTRIVRAERLFDMDLQANTSTFSFENFTGDETKVKNYNTISLEVSRGIVSNVLFGIERFFKRLFEKIGEAFSFLFNVNDVLKKRIILMEEYLKKTMEDKPHSEHFKGDKIINKFITTKNHDIDNRDIQDQFSIQKKASDITLSYTETIANTLIKFNKGLDSDIDGSLSKARSAISSLSNIKLGDNDKPLAGYVYYVTEITNIDSKDVLVKFDNRISKLKDNDTKTCETLSKGDIERLLDTCRKVVEFGDVAFAMYKKYEYDVSASHKSAMNMVKKLDKENVDVTMLTTMTNLMYNLFTLGPALTVTVHQSSLSCVDATLRCIHSSLDNYN